MHRLKAKWSLLGVFVALLLVGLASAVPARADGFGNDSLGCAADRPCITDAYQDGHSVVVRWRGDVAYDAYNVRWARPGRAVAQIETSGGADGIFTLRRVRAATVYSFWVQGCVHHFLAESTCSPWEGPRDVPTMPADACAQGYVWREAAADDHVCVTPETRDQAAYDNSQAGARVDPQDHTWGPDTCAQGYVWREATSPQDHVCVTPDTRAQAALDNSQAPYRVAR